MQLQLGDSFSLDELARVADGTATLVLDKHRAKVAAARAFVEKLQAQGDDAPNVYGVNTGFGALAETRIQAAQMRTLQRNLVRSHACGVGPALPEGVVRIMTALRAQTLALGHSGVRPELVDALAAMLHAGVHPVIPSQGSVGASGDLAPLAHLALVLIGEGQAIYKGEKMSGAEALKKAGLTPMELEAKEGLALINGTQMIVAVGAYAVIEAERLCRTADVVGAMSLEALKGSKRPFDPRIQEARRHPGQSECAANLRALLNDSQIMDSHVNCAKVQDPYSLRCMPQVHGATRMVLMFTREVLERETAAATDNPLIFLRPPGEGDVSDETGGMDVISGGNFHGQPLALALDAAKAAVAELANVSERRIEQLVNPAMSSGLPPFLAPHSGLDSGFMMAQVTAAALVSENKVLAHPSSVDSIPSSAGKEDHVSMGSISCRHLQQIVDNVRKVLAIEGLVAGQGIDFRAPLAPGKGVAAAHAELRKTVPVLEGDRELHIDIAAAEALVQSGALVTAAEAVVGRLA